MLSVNNMKAAMKMIKTFERNAAFLTGQEM